MQVAARVKHLTLSSKTGGPRYLDKVKNPWVSHSCRWPAHTQKSTRVSKWVRYHQAQQSESKGVTGNRTCNRLPDPIIVTDEITTVEGLHTVATANDLPLVSPCESWSEGNMIPQPAVNIWKNRIRLFFSFRRQAVSLALGCDYSRSGYVCYDKNIFG